jgi:hypothetical protein
MNQEPETAELLPLNTIRTETVLSRFPIHRLSKRGHINIEVIETNAEGELKTKWKVSHNSEYGQPGPLEYKLDTIFINRKLEESGTPIPAVIKLGSRHEIALELGLGGDTNTVKRALLKNASAFITVKRTYTAKDKTEKKIEAAFTRYSIIFTGEKLPDGRMADAVYLILNEIYREILNTAQTRPLDYDYLRELTPGAQRLYEMLSYQVFAALRNERPRAKMLYSYYCTRAPQTRYLDYDHVKKQMYKLHAPHRRSGYITAVEFRETTDSAGQPDWEMLYTPGRRARTEFRAFTQSKRVSSLKTAKELPLPQPEPAAAIIEADSGTDVLLDHLRRFGVIESKARELVKSHREAVQAQIAAYPYREVGKPRKNAAGWLIAAIEGNYTLPVAYLEEQEKKQQAAKAKEQRSVVEGCQLCDEKGWRRIRTPKYPDGAMKQCSHDPQVEAKYSDA